MTTICARPIFVLRSSAYPRKQSSKVNICKILYVVLCICIFELYFKMRRFFQSRIQNIINILLSLFTGNKSSEKYYGKFHQHAPSEENLPLISNNPN